MNHILHQNLLLEELKEDIGRLQRSCDSTVDVILYINNHIQGLINMVNDISARMLLKKEYLTKSETQELHDIQDMQDLTKKLIPLLYLLDSNIK